MTVDQADDVAAPAAMGSGRPRHASAVHTPWPDAPTMELGPNVQEPAQANVPVAAPGLAGLWPAPHAGIPRTARRVLPAEITAPRSAREFTQVTLEAWDLASDAEDVVVAVSELVTNALRHGLDGLPQPLPLCPIQLVLIGHPRRLVVSVTDPGGRTPQPIPSDPDRFVEGGRGLLVVGAISDSWGWARLATGGKAVWAAFDLRVSPPGPPEQAAERGRTAPDSPAR
ncbi:ATP-binding protein [Actinomadura darangshiensis]|uniref:ATP-binding protein n=1 Tax=Actinomadura darangshiensis TaxID=705336 RepID=A0A4R5ATB0_9ACTN|nr:ATP-binding protein [Actinomadura darangshiensis]TDD76241.1 ATP-binding protein [Actinomadura darangshiensis]